MPSRSKNSMHNSRFGIPKYKNNLLLFLNNPEEALNDQISTEILNFPTEIKSENSI